MTTYVDTSTLLKRLLDEEGSDQANAIWESAEHLVSAATLVVEARAALAAAERGRRLSPAEHRAAKQQLRFLLRQVDTIALDDDVLEVAADLAETEALRGYDAVHLAVALEVGVASLTSSDSALCDAAARRGLYVLNPLDT